MDVCSGQKEAETAFEAMVEKLMDDVGKQWRSLPEDSFPADMPHTSAQQRRETMARLRVLAVRRRKEDNRESTALVMNAEAAFVALMDSAGVFDASRRFARDARSFDPLLPESEEFQAGRNVWAALGLQILNGDSAECSSAITGYSLLYPYSDNYLDDPLVALEAKNAFQSRFGCWLRGQTAEPQSVMEEKVQRCVGLVEQKWPRENEAHGRVYASLVAIWQAQSASLAQHAHTENVEEIMRVTMFKGGTSVLADLYLSDPNPSDSRVRLAFALGFALQVVDDIQDGEEDAAQGHQTPMTLASDPSKLVHRLCHFLQMILPGKSVAERGVRAMSYVMVLKHVSRVQHLFDNDFLAQAEELCPLPMDNMPRLQGMKTLLKMVKADKL